SDLKPKKSPSPIAKTSKNKSGKKHQASAAREKAPTAIPHAKLANEESEKKADSSPKEKKSRTPSSKAKSAKQESTGDDNADAQEPRRVGRAKAKSADEKEAPPKPTPRETPEPP